MRNIHEGTRSKMKEEVEIKPQEAAHTVSTKCCYTCGGEEHLSKKYSRKRERFPTFKVEYEDQELEDLLALERPKRKKNHHHSKEKETRHLLCYCCKEPGHYASKCLEKKKNNKAKEQRVENGSTKKLMRDLSHVTCYKCRNKGHYANKCTEKLLL
jgi:hypothetical protein